MIRVQADGGTCVSITASAGAGTPAGVAWGSMLLGGPAGPGGRESSGQGLKTHLQGQLHFTWSHRDTEWGQRGFGEGGSPPPTPPPLSCRHQPTHPLGLSGHWGLLLFVGGDSLFSVGGQACTSSCSSLSKKEKIVRR